MTDVILGAVAQKIADLAVNLTAKEASRLSHLKEYVDWIKSEMRHIQCYLEDAEAKQLKTKGVSNLVKEIWDLAYDVEDIMATCFPKLTTSSRSQRMKGLLGCRYLRNARAFAKEIEGIKVRVENIKSARQTFGINESSLGREEDTWDARLSFPHVDEPNIVGLDKQIRDLEQKVLGEDLHNRVVSVVGMAGLGKTTLPKKVYNSVRQRFECSAWICASLQPNVKELLRDIARQVGLKKEKWEHNVEANLFAFLNGKRYAIVIDDIWRIEVWDALKNGIPTNSENSSRIILTSRNREVGAHVGGPNSLLELQPLDVENSRKLFFKRIKDDSQNILEAQDSPQLEKIGELILERCGGVPLAIVLAAGLLMSKERLENAWRGVLEGMGQKQDECSEIFALSYKDLPPNLKPCFLYFGLFPEDHEIKAFNLINLWAAEGFIRGSAVREVEDVGDDYLNHLIARNMIQVVERRSNGRVRSCRIHDILHSLCIREAEGINFFSTYGDLVKNNSALKARRLTTYGSDINDYLSLDYQNPKLRSMLCFNGHLSQKKRFKNLLRGSKFLRVLSFDCNHFFKSLPTGIGNLRQLTYLKLGTGIFETVELPCAIKNLVSLQTLDFKSCDEVILPNVIWSMKQFRHILLRDNCYAPSFRGVNLDVFHPIEFSLPNLQTLDGLPRNLFKAEWLYKLTNLRTLGVNYLSDRIMEVLSDATTPVSHKLEDLWLSGTTIPALQINCWNLSRYENLCELCIEHVEMGDQFPQFDKLPPNLTKITLEFTYLEKDPMETLKKLQKLKILILGYDSYMGEELVCSGEPGNFPQLEVFEINYMNKLKVLVVEEGGMPKVNDLRMVGCKPELRISDRLRNTVNFTQS